MTVQQSGLLLVFIIILAHLSAASKLPILDSDAKSPDEYPKITCYDGKGQTGEDLEVLAGFIGDLSWGYRFDDKISSCCFLGIWMLYEDSYYNDDYHDVRN